MTIVSDRFTAFVLLAVVAHHLLPARFRTAMLLVVSYVFCASLGSRALAILVGVTAANWVIGAVLAGSTSRRAAWLWLGIAINLGALFAERAATAHGPAIVAGLSFYALQAICYLVDTYSGALRARPSPVELALYLAYFPKLLAGPIERPRVFLERLRAPIAVDDEVLGRAATLVLTGLARKVAIADPLGAIIPANAFAPPLDLTPPSAVFALVTYAFVLYNDFAGYTSVVRGVSLLFGIELSPNFNRPFYAATYAEFWTRWHITLSNWLRDYIYMPTSRALLRRNPKIRNVPNVVIPPMATMLASGVWHGGSLNMMIWGAMHGAYLVGERVVGLVTGKPVAVAAKGRSRPLRIFLVFVTSTALLAFFRMETDVALRFFIKIATGAGTKHLPAQVLLLILPSLWLDWMQVRYGDENTFDHWRAFGRVALSSAALLFCFLMSHTAPQAPFIYQAF